MLAEWEPELNWVSRVRKSIRDQSVTVAQLISQAAAGIGENLVVRRFTRWEINPEQA